jgi:hypothetical protein
MLLEETVSRNNCIRFFYSFIIIATVLFPADTRGLKPIDMEVCYWALLFMPLVILLYLYLANKRGFTKKKNVNVVLASQAADQRSNCMKLGLPYWTPSAIKVVKASFDPQSSYEGSVMRKVTLGYSSFPCQLLHSHWADTLGQIAVDVSSGLSQRTPSNYPRFLCSPYVLCRLYKSAPLTPCFERNAAHISFLSRPYVPGASNLDSKQGSKNGSLCVGFWTLIYIIMFLGSKVRRVRRADNLTAICEPIV